MTEISKCLCCDNSGIEFKENYNNYIRYDCIKCRHSIFLGGSSISREDYVDSDKYQDYYEGEPPNLWYHKKALSYISKEHSGSKVLDFGCYDGFFVKKMVDSKINAYGNDWNTAAMNAGILKFGLEGRLFETSEEVYEAVTALEVIEHFEDPNEFMRIVKSKMDKNGSLIISMPYRDSIYRPSTDYPPHHFSRFTEQSIKALLEKHGFVVERYEIESSFFQVIRNIIGDKMRKSSSNIENTDKPIGTKNSIIYSFLRRSANKAGFMIKVLTLPLDVLMRFFRIYYLSHFVVAKIKKIN